MPIDPAAFNALPYLQIAAAALVILGGVWMMVQAQRDKAKIPPPAAMPEGLQMFFNGPLVQALQCLSETNKSLREMVHSLANITMIMAKAESNTREVKEELAEQTAKHTDLMRTLINVEQNVLDELRRHPR
jgi:hypothetical protein